MDIRIFPPMATRPCNFCLSLQGGSVFADFKIDEQGHAFIVRISYDGYGCCHPSFGESGGRLAKPDTATILAAIKRDEIQSPAIERILESYFLEHRESLWKDALVDHELIRNDGDSE